MNKAFETVEHKADFCVVGGGMSGICAAIAAARHGLRVVLMHDRPVFGGNASSEIRMHIVGATRHGERENLRKTGIIKEILLENKHRNPEHSYGLFDTLLWEKVNFQENLDLYLNAYVNSLDVKNGKINSIFAIQTTTEKRLEISAKQFIDCSGDVHLVDFMDGSVYKLPDEMKVSGDYAFTSGDSTVWGEPKDENAYTCINLLIKDYPMALIFGDIKKFM